MTREEKIAKLEAELKALKLDLVKAKHMSAWRRQQVLEEMNATARELVRLKEQV